MRFILLILMLVYTVSSLTPEEKRLRYNSYKSKFRKRYCDSQEKFRYNIIDDKLEKIEEHNKLYDKGLVSFKMALNVDSDLTREEFLAHRTGLIDPDNPITKPLVTTRPTTKKTTIKKKTTLKKKTTKRKPLVNDFFPAAGISTAQPTTTAIYYGNPAPVRDWRQNVTLNVKDQGNCGCCWAFSAIGVLEAHSAIKYGTKYNLSEQNLVDCSGKTTLFKNNGCNGGSYIKAFKYIASTLGANTEAFYPFTGIDGPVCNYNSQYATAKIRNITILNTESDIEQVVSFIGPVAIALDASDAFMSYTSGVFTASYCNTTVNHGVMIVGYNNTNNPPYWIIKNSWGTTWGENGYIRLQKGVNACGLTSSSLKPTYPIV